MTERLASWSAKDYSKRGIPSPGLINVYRRWAEGGAGLISTGNIMVAYDQLEAAGNTIIPPDSDFSGERFEAFKKMSEAGKKEGNLIVGQVSHPGRQTSSDLQPDPVSASDVQLEGNIMGLTFAKPHAASQQEIDQIVESFAHAAEYLYKAGYDGIQLHGAHGYLLAQFLSQTTNKRTDQYGGSLRNRARIIMEIAEKIQQRVPKSFMLGIKTNSVEFQAGGIQPEEARDLCAMLEELEFDFIELSGGTYEKLAFNNSHQRESSKKRESFFFEFAEQITPRLTQTKVYVTGGFKTVAAMTDSLDSVHGVGLARPITQEPRIPKDILNGKVHAAISQHFDQQDFGITNMVAGSQIRQIAKDLEPMDGSDDENVKAFQNDMGTWMEGMKNNSSGEKYGYVDLDTLPAMPYATAAPAS
ncbi:MAG: hypothetical protein M1831_002328 [Alyxoria varia]|nr:MAG: hypothetical protein M1831_002328 [Alyxoria varia]